MRSSRSMISRLAAVSLLAACAADAPLNDDVTVTVENGVTIVTNPGLHIADSVAWTLDSADIVSIGMEDGPPEYLFGRIAGIVLMSDGNVLVGDGIAHELRVFDVQGRFVRKVGRAGEGPGEYGWLSTVLPHAADSIAVLDNERSRVTILDPQLRFVRRYHPRLEASHDGRGYSHRLIGFFADGLPLMKDLLSACGRGSGRLCADSMAVFRTDHDGRTQSAFGRFVHSRSELFEVSPGNYTGWREPHPQPMWAVHGDHFYYADAMRFEIRVFANTGSLERVIRVATSAPRYERAEVWPRHDYEPDPEFAETYRVLREKQATTALPDTFPAFNDMRVDPAGNIWLREYLPDGVLRTVAPRWLVFDPEGRLRWALRTYGLQSSFEPSDNTPLYIGTDHIAIRGFNADGVENVVLYRLNKASR